MSRLVDLARPGGFLRAFSSESLSRTWSGMETGSREENASNQESNDCTTMIEKNYQPADIEARMSLLWEDSRAFNAGRPERRDAKPFTIVIPPPNVTGSLHMGHALNNTLQDILCR